MLVYEVFEIPCGLAKWFFGTFYISEWHPYLWGGIKLFNDSQRQQNLLVWTASALARRYLYLNVNSNHLSISFLPSVIILYSETNLVLRSLMIGFVYKMISESYSIIKY